MPHSSWPILALQMSNITKPSGQVPGNLMVSMPRPAPAKPRSDPPSASEEERRLVPRGEPEELPRPGPEEAFHHFRCVPHSQQMYNALPEAIERKWLWLAAGPVFGGPCSAKWL